MVALWDQEFLCGSFPLTIIVRFAFMSITKLSNHLDIFSFMCPKHIFFLEKEEVLSSFNSQDNMVASCSEEVYVVLSPSLAF